MPEETPDEQKQHQEKRVHAVLEFWGTLKYKGKVVTILFLVSSAISFLGLIDHVAGTGVVDWIFPSAISRHAHDKSEHADDVEPQHSHHVIGPVSPALTKDQRDSIFQAKMSRFADTTLLNIVQIKEVVARIPGVAVREKKLRESKKIIDQQVEDAFGTSYVAPRDTFLRGLVFVKPYTYWSLP